MKNLRTVADPDRQEYSVGFVVSCARTISPEARGAPDKVLDVLLDTELPVDIVAAAHARAERHSLAVELLIGWGLCLN